MTRRIQLRRDTGTTWTSVDPVLAAGEIGVDLTTGQIKIGDGSGTWSELEYYSGSDVDLTGYATEEYVDDAIAAIPPGGGEVDLSGYATEEYVDDAVGAIEIPDVSNFITAEDIPAIPADISDLTDTEGLLGSGTADTGDVTFDGVKIIGAGTASGDGNGYSTLELVPDNNLYANDQYLVVDPTAPSHIHIRAGGAQDASNAELYLGGEKNYVRVTDSNGVRLYNESSFDNTEYYLDGTQFTSAVWTAGAEGQQSTVTFTSTDQNFVDILFNIFNDDRNTLQVVTPEGTFTLTPTGFGSLGNDVWRFNVNEIPDPTPQTVSEIILTIWTTRQNSLSLSNNDLTVEVTDDIRITGRDTFVLRNSSTDESIQIITSYGTDSHNWEFSADGTTYLPRNSNSSISYLSSPLNDDSIKLSLGGGNGVQIVADEFSGSTTVWQFGTDGGLTFPDNTVQTTAYTGSLLSTEAVTGGTASVGAATAITVTNSPNPNWTTGTGVFANDINFVVAVDDSGNATVTTINDGGTGHFVGETFGPVPGSAFGGTDEVDDMYFEITEIDLTTTTALDLTKSVNKLADGYYTLADGVEGQTMYLVRQTGSVDANIFVQVANARLNGTVYTDLPHYPFSGGSSQNITMLIFTDGAWQSNNGTWD